MRKTVVVILGALGLWLVVGRSLPILRDDDVMADESKPPAAPVQEAKAGEATPSQAKSPPVVLELLQAIGAAGRSVGVDTNLPLSDIAIEQWNRGFTRLEGRPFTCLFVIRDIRTLNRPAPGQVTLCVLLEWTNLFKHVDDLVQCNVAIDKENRCRPPAFDPYPTVGLRVEVTEAQALRIAGQKGMLVECSSTIGKVFVERTPIFSVASSVSDFRLNVELSGLRLGDATGKGQGGNSTPVPTSEAGTRQEPPAVQLCAPCGGSGWNDGPCGLCNGTGRR